jgi:GTPase SAR1 family protein
LTDTNASRDYEEFRKKRSILLSLIQRQLRILDALNMAGWVVKVQRLEQRVRDDNFKVFVMGEFKRGKSTFINSMLGQEVLPAYATPCTAIINEVKWGDKPQAKLHLISPPKGSMDNTKEIPVDQLEDYVVIQVNQSNAYSDDGRPVYESPYEKVELFWPLDICRDGVEVIDSPGLNEDEKRQRITLDYLAIVDAVIFVISCLAPISSSERSAINTVRESGYEDIFFICNRINEVRPKEQDRLKNFCLTQLSPLTKQKDRYVFFINALGALDGRIEGDMRRLEESGLLPIELELRNFLANERGRVKLVRPTTELKVSIREARRTIPDRAALLRTDLDTLAARYEEAKTKLVQFEMVRANIVKRVEVFRRDTRNRVSDAANHFFSDVADKVRSWIQEYDIKKPMGLHEVFNKDAQKRVVEEVTTFLTESVARESKQWQTSQLQPLLQNRLEMLAQDLEDKTGRFVEGLDQVRNELVVGADFTLTPDAVKQEKVSALERIFAAATGLVLVDLGSAAL